MLAVGVKADGMWGGEEIEGEEGMEGKEGMEGDEGRELWSECKISE